MEQKQSNASETGDADPEIQSQLRELARLVGGLLAREWLRRQSGRSKVHPDLPESDGEPTNPGPSDRIIGTGR